jgi:hypothetical protein
MLRRRHRALHQDVPADRMAGPLEYNFVMGVASGAGIAADPAEAEIAGRNWQVTAIGRRNLAAAPALPISEDIYTGLRITFYLGDGAKVTSTDN